MRDVVEPVFEEAHSSSAMLQDCYRLDVFVDVDSDEIAPDVSNHYDGKKIGHTLAHSDMRPLYVKAAAFQTLVHLGKATKGEVHTGSLVFNQEECRYTNFRTATPRIKRIIVMIEMAFVAFCCLRRMAI